ncbi:thiolase family protein [Azoarcus sp. L1K30]|uniref:thiolase family protein n=1 Tax=Azoarcus sp. L1K30 TaxID=2820277 RepID=UPI001B8168CA|nr:thiolase family protein [Azoarcus sp. L1K30]MBR0567509.1 thiolase family protein [Azoarcus sp. L1K30]
MSGEVYIAGIGSTAFGRQPDVSLLELAAEAGRRALADAGIKPADVGIGFFANALAGKLFGDLTIGQNVFAALGMSRLPIANVENACTSGSTAFYLACLAVRAGEVDCAMVIGAEKMCVPQLGLLSSGDSELDTLLGLVTPASFAMRARRHMAEFGTTVEQLAQVSVKNRSHGVLNALAQFRSEVSLGEVLASPMIADPLTRFQSCPIADGASALIVCSESMARRLGARITVRAATLSTGNYDNPQDMVRWRTDREGVEKAYEIAGVGPADLDVIECHDAFTIAEILHYEALGLCPVGEGGRLVAEGVTALGGSKPVNVSGGLLARGHPVGATGVEQIVELTRQLRGNAGARQVHGARLGLAHCMGGDRAADTKSMTVAVLAA